MRSVRLAAVLLAALGLASPAAAGIGDLDPSFGTSGVTLTSVGNGGLASADAAALAPDGSIVAAGQAVDNGVTRPAVVRLGAGGAVDGTFSGDGVAIVPAGTGPGAFYDVRVLADGSVIAAGQADDGGTTKVLVAKLNPVGELDPGFGAGGVALLPFGDGGQAAAFAVLVVDGAIVVAGSAVDGGATKLLVARLTGAGALDAGFGAGGAQLVALGDGGSALATGLSVLPGNILVASGSATDGPGKKVALVQLSASGAVENQRLVAVGDGGSSEALAASVSNFKPVVVGSAIDDGKTAMFVARFQASLAPDELFGKEGGALVLPVGDGGNAVAQAVDVGADGKIVVAGRADDGLSGAAYAVKTALARLDQLGQPDAAFGPQSRLPGTVLVNIGCDGGEGASGVEALGDGRIVAAGTASGAGAGGVFAFARFVDTQPGGGTGGCEGAGVDTPGPGGGPGGGVGECLDRAELGPLVFRGACFKLVAAGKIEVTGTMQLNGVRVTTGSASKLVIDPGSRRVYTAADKGALGKGTIRIELGSDLGDITIYEGSIDWSVPGKPFSIDNLVIPPGADFKGFPIIGRPKLEFGAGSLLITLPVKLPRPVDRVTGELKVIADLDKGVQFDGLTIRAKEFPLGPLVVRDFLISYSFAFDSWEGKAVLVLPFPQRYGAGAGFGFKNGRFAHAEAEVNGLNIPIAQAVFLQRIKIALGVDPLLLAGGIGISAGPTVLGAALVQIDGNLTWRLPDPPVPALLRADGAVLLAAIEIATGYLQYTSDGRFELGGQVSYGLKPLVGFEGGLRVFVTTDGVFEGEANGEVCGLILPPFVCVEAKALVNARAFAACAALQLLTEEIAGGFVYRWGESPEFFEGCDLGPYREPAPAGASSRALRALERALGTQGFQLAAGARVAAVRIEGAGGAVPKVRVQGPDGSAVESAADGSAVVRQGGFLLAEDPAGAVVVLVERPASGRWTVTPLPGSPAVAAIRVSRALPAVQVTGRVLGAGRTPTLGYDVTTIAGQTVRFVERARGAVLGEIGVARGAKGSLGFTPAPGPGGRREIVALVEQDGVPRTSIVVARYTAPPTPKAGRPGTVRLRRAGASAVVSFQPGRGAVAHEVYLTTGAGQVLYAQVTGKTARFLGTASQGALTTSVRAIDVLGRPGPAAVAKLAAVPPRTRTVQGTVAKVDLVKTLLVVRSGGRNVQVVLRPSTRYRRLGGAAALRAGQQVSVLAEVRSFDGTLLALEVRRG